MLTDSDIQRFREVYELETGEKLSPEESLVCAENLLELVQAVYKPIRKDSVQEK